RLALYDAPGGRPRRTLRYRCPGRPWPEPVVLRAGAWPPVLAPPRNGAIVGWHRLWPAPPSTAPSAAESLVDRPRHRWPCLRDGVPKRSWTVTLGNSVTPTPLGRTFILGRSRLQGEVYADTDVFALGAAPDEPEKVPYGLRGAHIGIHTWYNDWTLGKNDTD